VELIKYFKGAQTIKVSEPLPRSWINETKLMTISLNSHVSDLTEFSSRSPDTVTNLLIVELTGDWLDLRR
jgi:hypothetical protein